MAAEVKPKGARTSAASSRHPARSGGAPLPASPSPLVELMTVRQAAGFAQVSESSIRRWIREEELPAYRSRGLIRIDKSELFKFMSK